MASNKHFRIVLITGQPGVGKTTLIKKLHDKLCLNETLKLFLRGGFYTEEVRSSSHERIGFDVVDLKQPSSRARLARVTYVFIV